MSDRDHRGVMELGGRRALIEGSWQQWVKPCRSALSPSDCCWPRSRSCPRLGPIESRPFWPTSVECDSLRDPVMSTGFPYRRACACDCPGPCSPSIRSWAAGDRPDLAGTSAGSIRASNRVAGVSPIRLPGAGVLVGEFVLVLYPSFSPVTGLSDQVQESTTNGNLIIR